MRRLVAAVVGTGLLVAGCGSSERPTDTAPAVTTQPGAVLRVAVTEVIAASGQYRVPAGNFTMHMQCMGSVAYVVRAGMSLSGSCQGGGGTSTIGVFTGPGTATFTVSSGYLVLTLQ
jgi:hypothetical protein